MDCFERPLLRWDTSGPMVMRGVATGQVIPYVCNIYDTEFVRKASALVEYLGVQGCATRIDLRSFW